MCIQHFFLSPSTVVLSHTEMLCLVSVRISDNGFTNPSGLGFFQPSLTLISLSPVLVWPWVPCTRLSFLKGNEFVSWHQLSIQLCEPWGKDSFVCECCPSLLSSQRPPEALTLQSSLASDKKGISYHVCTCVCTCVWGGVHTHWKTCT
jgi:hypothetical protein